MFYLANQTVFTKNSLFWFGIFSTDNKIWNVSGIVTEMKGLCWLMLSWPPVNTWIVIGRLCPIIPAGGWPPPPRARVTAPPARLGPRPGRGRGRRGQWVVNTSSRHPPHINQDQSNKYLPFDTDCPANIKTGLYRSCAALASFSGTFDLILFQALNIEFIFEKVWFGLVSIEGLNNQIRQNT